MRILSFMYFYLFIFFKDTAINLYIKRKDFGLEPHRASVKTWRQLLRYLQDILNDLPLRKQEAYQIPGVKICADLRKTLKMPKTKIFLTT